MKAVIVSIVLGALLILIGGVWAVFNLPVTIPGIHAESEIATVTIVENTEAYTIDAQYPQFDIPDIDAQIRSDVERALTEFRALPKNPSDSATQKNTFTGRFENAYRGEDIVSVKLILSQYTGGAHNLTLISGVSFDRKTGKRLLLNDALPYIGKSVETISEVATAQFKEKFGEGFFSEGATSNPENFSSFVIEKDTVTFIFQQYQVAAYAFGPQAITFPRVK